MRLYKMNSTALFFKNRPEEFLQGVTSNSISRPKNAFLNTKGKIIATCDQRQCNDDTVLMVVAADCLPALRQHLEKLLMLSDTTMEKSDAEIYWDLDDSYQASASEWVLSQKAGQLLITSKTLQSQVSEEEFREFRLDHGFPLHGIDYHDEMLLNVHETDYVSYDKGCFIGQEVIARVHYKSKPPRKLVVVTASDVDASQRGAMTSVIKDSKSGDQRGFLFVSNK